MSRKDILLSKIGHVDESVESDASDFSSNTDKAPQKRTQGDRHRNPSTTEEATDWLDESYDGQLAVDVFQNDKEIVIKSTIAGVKPEDIDVAVQHDMVTIKGKREHKEDVTEDDYFYQECYWGGFSRTIILPVDVITDAVDAQLENGILTIRLPKAASSASKNIKVRAV